ncbi:M2 family metallopeptidase [Daejeonella lutea]|uniref:Peptidyl-dipeptidase A n=1 Tax=Daejeonella lutea TaxID=572036 RepID=A0A1T5DNQ2_9SPHI|nr:M2 family metallopeptidase [Daejeonella lutea]SKB73286.1 peptidyl-dipeptidase A [Daejeonella lutea]
MRNLTLFFVLLISTSCNTSKPVHNAEAQAFIDSYTEEYVKLYTASSDAQWAANTKIVEGDSTNAKLVERTGEAYAAFTGSKENIGKAQDFLKDRSSLSALQEKQLDKILYFAANNPQTVSNIVKERIKAENAQTEKLFGFDFKVDGKSVSANDIDNALKDETDLVLRLKVWESSKEVGVGLKPGLLNLRKLRNKTVQALGYKNYFDYQVSDYGMSTGEMMDLIQKINLELRPLYRELHTYARYELAKKYNVKEVPEYLPAHWLPNRWGQDWSSMVTVTGMNLDSVLKTKSAEYIVKDGEDFYKSLGFNALPGSFWQKSSLYPAPVGAAYKKNNHASAWHMDLNEDVRSLMSVEPNSEWYETANHELGHIYYYMSYTNKDVPPLMREGANRAYHEAMGSLMGLASVQKPFLEKKGIIPTGTKSDGIQALLKEALNYVVFIPFSAGTMTEFEKSLYADELPADQINSKWWELAKKYQGIVPPSVRGENFADAASKTHINDDAAQYYDYALSFVILFQLHDHIAKKILKEDPRATNYYGNKEVGKFLKEIMTPGSSKDWKEVLREKTGSDLTARPMLDYFEPLMKWLKEQNKGRVYTLAEGF